MKTTAAPLAFVTVLWCLSALTALGAGLQNPDFESGRLDGWQTFSSTASAERIDVIADPGHENNNALQFSAQGVTNAYQGVFQAHAVTPGRVYQFSVDARVVRAGQGRGQVSIEWKNSAGDELQRSWGADWPTAETAAEWSRFRVTATAPAHAARAHFVVTQFEPAEGTDTGIFLIDNAALDVE